MSHPTVTFFDLTADEQEHARNALHFLRVKLSSWKAVTRLLHFEHVTVMQVANGTRTVTASMAFRIAKTGRPRDEGRNPARGRARAPRVLDRRHVLRINLPPQDEETHPSLPAASSRDRERQRVERLLGSRSGHERAIGEAASPAL